MNLSFTQLLFGTVGVVLIFSAVQGKSPVQMVKDALNGSAAAGEGVPSPQGYSTAAATANAASARERAGSQGVSYPVVAPSATASNGYRVRPV